MGQDKAITMLKQLYIKNFTLIDELSINFNPGFSVITGETGAGKSIIIGAIGLLAGNRADARQIKAGAEKCTVEAHFDISRYGLKQLFDDNEIDYDAEDCIVRREINSSGKSRAFVNDTPVGLNVLRELGSSLIDIHSQHQNLMLQKEDFQLGVIDTIAKDQAEKDAYREAYGALKAVEKQIKDLRESIERSRENEEYLRFQVDELRKANLEKGLQERLEEESKTMSHAEEIKSGLYESDSLLNDEDAGILTKLRQTSQSLEQIEDLYPRVKDLHERLESSYIELQDIASEVNAGIEDIDFDPQRLEEVNERLDTIYSLEQKFHVATVEELMETLSRFEQQLHDIEYSDDEIKALEKQQAGLKAKADELAGKLTEARRRSAKTIEGEMQKRLVPLGMPNIRFSVDLKPKPLAEDGADSVQFLFSANTSTPLLPIAQIASGGEISRVMLSLKAMISGAVKLPTIIFDEIDTGVSGRVAEQMARIMSEMGSAGRQVISITHLPQIAALGTTHYRVSKQETPQGTASTMTMLTKDERIKEIAQMLSGNKVSEAAIENAKTLLGI